MVQWTLPLTHQRGAEDFLKSQFKPTASKTSVNLHLRRAKLENLVDNIQSKLIVTVSITSSVLVYRCKPSIKSFPFSCSDNRKVCSSMARAGQVKKYAQRQFTKRVSVADKPSSLPSTVVLSPRLNGKRNLRSCQRRIYRCYNRS